MWKSKILAQKDRKQNIKAKKRKENLFLERILKCKTNKNTKNRENQPKYKQNTKIFTKNSM